MPNKNNKYSNTDIFKELGFSEQEAGNLKVRSKLMHEITQYIESQNITQVEAAERFGVSQPRISDLMRGKLHVFTVDTLINMLHRVGYNVQLNVLLPNFAGGKEELKTREG
ncbi:MAG: XRE family transcriptional regulator [Proteobacteria bacterium]|nr:XRE family transcriptional regulator [Pseudomonadota bacterium]